MVNLRTTITPSNKVFTTSIIIAGGKARSLDELDRWRLFDVGGASVTYVDDLTKSYRSETLGNLIDPREPSATPADGSKFTATGIKRVINGVQSSQYLLSRGAYRRELWLANVPNIPDRLFAMMQVSRRPADAAELRQWAEAPLAALRGYPMDDHAQLPYGTSSLSIDRAVTGVEQKDVPAALLQLPSGYRDATAKPDGGASGHPRPSAPVQQTGTGAGKP